MMERETIERMGRDLERQATSEAQRLAALAVEDLAAGKVHMVAHWMQMARAQQLRAKRIGDAINRGAHLPYPADYHRAILAANAAGPEDRAVLEGLGELARRAMENANAAARMDPGKDVDWAQAVEEVDAPPAVAIGWDPAVSGADSMFCVGARRGPRVHLQPNSVFRSTAYVQRAIAAAERQESNLMQEMKKISAERYVDDLLERVQNFLREPTQQPSDICGHAKKAEQ